MAPRTRRLLLLGLACCGCIAGLAQAPSAEVEFKRRSDAVALLVRADPLNWPLAETQAEALLNDYPRRFDGYLNLLVLTWQAELAGNRDLERKLAKEMTGLVGPDPSETPDWAGLPVRWAQGVIYRLDLAGRPVELQFVATDGRKVDLASMKGKVVVVDFWATWCPPCIASLPGLKRSYERYHAKGLEVVSISWDIDREKLSNFVERNGVAWPQYFEGRRRKFGEEFGIGGIPYALLVDKEGRLRSASAFPDDPNFVGEIPKLLAERRTAQ